MNRAKLLIVAAALLYGPLVPAAESGTTPITVDAAAKKNETAGVEMEVVFKGVAPEGFVFDVAFDTMKMDAPPLDSDLSKLATLVVDGGEPISPSSWTIRQTGHMNHHLRGRLVFPAEANGRPVLGPGAKAFELRLAGTRGEPQAVFPWSIVGR